MNHLASITAIAAVCLFLTFGPSLAEETTSAMWQARAFKAADRISVIRQRLEALKDRWDSSDAYEARCEVMLEAAFAMHVLEEPVVHKTVDGIHAFKILLMADNNRYFDITYIYKRNARDVEGVKILALPPDWELIFPANARGAIVQVPTSDSALAAPRQACAFGFSLDNPFLAHVMRR
jgi:hypothetical protein